jgi:alkanesulfonate monooxygenase SsuD/methylene tetrahydromethanopterin reductase-like flavin-dependent oxidoreductase (luciferase family)
MDEALALVRRLWTEDKVAYEGRFFSLPELTMEPRPVQPAGPPIWVAGVDPRAVDRAARLGDAWMCGPVQTWTAAKACLARYRASCEAAGTSPAWVLRRYTRLAGSRRELEEDYLPGFVDAQLAYWRTSVETDEERALFARIDAGEPMSPAEVAADRFVGGTPDDVIAELERYREETGCSYVHVGFGGRLESYDAATSSGAAQLAEMRTMIERFARDVMPALA